MEYANPDALVSTEWLAEHLADPDLRIVDATWFPESAGRIADIEYEIRHIPGALYLDSEELCGTEPFGHILPDADRFAETVGALGIGNHHRIVVYDASGGWLVGAWAWWLFRVFGHENVALLDGGLLRWMREKRPMGDEPPTPRPCPFLPHPNPALVRNVEQMLSNLDSRREQVIDVRNAERFSGAMSDAYNDNPAKLGHIPGSVNVLHTDLMDEKDDHVMVPADRAARVLADAGLDLKRPIVTYCGTGIVAAVVNLALFMLGHTDNAIYDQSFAEWGNRADTPVEIRAGG
jgi:thiosulfate/3-mercaptopyruvate sulfurtransferase